MTDTHDLGQVGGGAGAGARERRATTRDPLPGARDLEGEPLSPARRPDPRPIAAVSVPITSAENPTAERGATPHVTARLLLHQGASALVRRHLTRSIARVGILVSADLISLSVARALLRAVRDYDVLGPGFAGLVGQLFPRGILGGMQYATALILALAITGNYGRGDQRRNAGRVFLASVLATALPLWIVLWNRGLGSVLPQYVLTTLLVWAAVCTDRFTIDRIVTWTLGDVRRVPAILVGSAVSCEAAMERAVFRPGGDLEVVGFVDTRIPPTERALGHVANFAEILQSSAAEVVVFCGYLSEARFHEIVDASLAAGVQILSVQPAIEVAGVTPQIVWRYGDPLIELTAPTLKGRQLFVKRVMDVAGSLVGLVVFGIPMLLIAAAIKLDSPGPGLFSQERVGLGGKRFRILKFRTMRVGADAEKNALAHLNHTGDSRLFKIPNDPRVTKLGGWLRRLSLDELPQLWNVLAGDMSLVGPRPFFETDLEAYEEHHFRRLGAKPGITGLWQVKGRSEVTDFEEVVRLDRDYIERWSIYLDLKILALTLPAVVRRAGAF